MCMHLCVCMYLNITMYGYIIILFDEIVFTVNVSIVLNDSPYMFVDGSNSSFHLVGSNITMLWLIKSTPFANSEFRWKRSTGCLGGVETGQKITVTAQQSGVIVCTYTADGIEYNSDPIQIHITGMYVSCIQSLAG